MQHLNGKKNLDLLLKFHIYILIRFLILGNWRIFFIIFIVIKPFDALGKKGCYRFFLSLSVLAFYICKYESHICLRRSRYLGSLCFNRFNFLFMTSKFCFRDFNITFSLFYSDSLKLPFVA